jgi:hypothetical protein
LIIVPFPIFESMCTTAFGQIRFPCPKFSVSTIDDGWIQFKGFFPVLFLIWLKTT